jgi:hypothetical protein
MDCRKEGEGWAINVCDSSVVYLARVALMQQLFAFALLGKRRLVKVQSGFPPARE